MTGTVISGASTVYHRTVKIDGLDIFYREAGDPSNPTLLLLHGFPTSSHMFRNLIPALADQYHLVAPDFPGYGNSSMPAVDEFDYTFDHLSQIVEKLVVSLEVQRYSLYLMDYGAPVGFRLAAAHPERVQALIIQNGNAYDEGIDNDFWEPIRAYWKDRGAINQGLDNDFWKNVKAAYKQPNMSNEDALRFLVTLGATQWQYTNGVRDKEVISPDNWHVTQRLLDRPGNEAIQLQLFYDYGSNPPHYPAWQEYLRTNQPPTLIVWGQNDEIFPADGAHPYKRDLTTLEFHLLDTGHFALKRPRFSWTRIKGESNVQGGGGNGSIEGRGTGRGIGADGGSPKGDWSPCRRGGGRGGLLGAGAAVERQPEARRGAAAAAWRIAGGAVP